ncbi:MAG: hypothetical protein SCARUB_00195 [Candidatus Scalindua rubra]|uniref:Uncharacterized protein n=1 Tax=Candidatus Scalindua rubra TaxID=1872076 RepID=A0A1E3XG52_9BACT|nr:MAG: hypothetical protein SCARUB_00195 [Candidatus Scalindua rubra]
MEMIILCIFCETGIQQSIYFILSVMGAGMLGFFALFLRSWIRGQYRDVEAPKFKMLELEEKQNEAQDG